MWTVQWENTVKDSETVSLMVSSQSMFLGVQVSYLLDDRSGIFGFFSIYQYFKVTHLNNFNKLKKLFFLKEYITSNMIYPASYGVSFKSLILIQNLYC